MPILFKKVKKLEAEIDRYFDLVVQGGLLFKQGLRFYLDGQDEDFESRLDSLRQIESKGDELRRLIEENLYLQTLIPEYRGDVLGLLESTDKVLNMLNETLEQFSVERPRIRADLTLYFGELCDAVVSAVEYTVSADRAYFNDLASVRDAITKVIFYEKESDRIAEKIKRKLFLTDDRLSYKIHQRYFTYHIEQIADAAEDVCDRLAIAAIKRFM